MTVFSNRVYINNYYYIYYNIYNNNNTFLSFFHKLSSVICHEYLIMLNVTMLHCYIVTFAYEGAHCQMVTRFRVAKWRGVGILLRSAQCHGSLPEIWRPLCPKFDASLPEIWRFSARNITSHCPKCNASLLVLSRLTAERYFFFFFYVSGWKCW